MVLALVAGWAFHTMTSVLSRTSGATAGAVAHPGGPSAQMEWRRHIDRQAGFTLDYPDSWQPFPTTDRSGAQFLVGPDARDLVEVRVITLPVTIGPGDVQGMKGIIDQILGIDKRTVLSETQVSHAGLTGWQYVYGITDKDGTTGVHIHVFLFDGNRLHTLMFQVLPATGLKVLAPTFDEVLGRYRTIPAASAAAPASPSPSPKP